MKKNGEEVPTCVRTYDRTSYQLDRAPRSSAGRVMERKRHGGAVRVEFLWIIKWRPRSDPEMCFVYYGYSTRI